MKESYSLLHEEGNYTKALYMKQLNQNPDYYEAMTESIKHLVTQNGTLQKILDRTEINIEESYNEHFDHIHAQYRRDENEHAIWLNLLWIDRYSQFMKETQARDLHIGHELFHLLETENKMWYQNMKRRERLKYSEVSAIYFSQLISDLPCHPYLYEYQSKINDNEIELQLVLDYLKEG